MYARNSTANLPEFRAKEAPRATKNWERKLESFVARFPRFSGRFIQRGDNEASTGKAVTVQLGLKNILEISGAVLPS